MTIVLLRFSRKKAPTDNRFKQKTIRLSYFPEKKTNFTPIVKITKQLPWQCFSWDEGTESVWAYDCFKNKPIRLARFIPGVGVHVQVHLLPTSMSVPMSMSVLSVQVRYLVLVRFRVRVHYHVHVHAHVHDHGRDTFNKVKVMTYSCLLYFSFFTSTSFLCTWAHVAYVKFYENRIAEKKVLRPWWIASPWCNCVLHSTRNSYYLLFSEKSCDECDDKIPQEAIIVFREKIRRPFQNNLPDMGTAVYIIDGMNLNHYRVYWVKLNQQTSYKLTMLHVVLDLQSYFRKGNFRFLCWKVWKMALLRGEFFSSWNR